jgi:phenylalanine-4-hydroxylase
LSTDPNELGHSKLRGIYMQFKSRYVSHKPDKKGFIKYSAAENHVWQLLYKRQMEILPNRACDEFILGLKSLSLNPTKIPQLPELNEKLKKTGWQVAPVAALISAREFFELLAHKHFPVATFIRVEEELNYVQEPDIFHEIFGHCPMLTNSVFADFVCNYALRVLEFPESAWPLLQRLFWFTVEFGLIKTDKGLRAYGGGILSSIGETAYSIESDLPLRILFNPLAAFRMPYRIDMLQRTYFVIDNFTVLYNLLREDLKAIMEKATELGEYPPLFPIEENNPAIHIHAC